MAARTQVDGQVAQEKSIPFNLEAERAVLGSILIDPDAWYKVSDTLSGRDFYRETHGWIWEALAGLMARARTVDFVLICDELESAGRLAEAGGPAYLTEIVGGTPTSINIEHYAEIVRFISLQRRLIAAAGEMAAAAWDSRPEDGIDALHEKAVKMIDAAIPETRDDEVFSLGAVMNLSVQAADDAARGNSGAAVRTGFTMLDRLLSGGCYPGDLVVVAGRPGQGKSAFGLAMALHAARLGVHTAFFTLEMTPAQLGNRLASMESGIDGSRLQSGELHDDEWPLLLEAANTLSRLPMKIMDTPRLSVAKLRAMCKRLNADQPLGLVLIDYMQLMTGEEKGFGYRRDENRQQEIDYISRSLKALAKELRAPVVALAQLNRAVESRSDKRPLLSDLRESGGIEQNADKVFLLYRDDYYNEDSERQNIADVIVAKHRTGATGTVWLYFRKELTQFRDLELQRTDLVY